MFASAKPPLPSALCHSSDVSYLWAAACLLLQIICAELALRLFGFLRLCLAAVRLAWHPQDLSDVMRLCPKNDKPNTDADLHKPLFSTFLCVAATAAGLDLPDSFCFLKLSEDAHEDRGKPHHLPVKVPLHNCVFHQYLKTEKSHSRHYLVAASILNVPQADFLCAIGHIYQRAGRP